MPASISRDLMMNVRGDVDVQRDVARKGGVTLRVTSRSQLSHRVIHRAMIDAWQIDIRRRRIFIRRKSRALL